MLGVITNLLFAAAKVPEESSAESGKKVIFVMLAVGVIFLLVIAIGELSHNAAKSRRRRDG